MNRASLLVISILSIATARADKPSIDYATFERWPTIDEEARISNDGSYVAYSMHTPDERTLILQSADLQWQRKLPGYDIWNMALTEDSRRAIALSRSNATLDIIELGRDIAETVPKVISFKMPKEGDGRWLAYQTGTIEKKSPASLTSEAVVNGAETPATDLVLRNLFTGKEGEFSLVTDYSFSDNGKTLVLQARSGKESSGTTALVWIDLSSGTKTTIWKGKKVSNLAFNENATRLAFVATEDESGQAVNTIWSYDAGTEVARLRVDGQTPGMESGFVVDAGKVEFSTDGRKLFFRLRRSQIDPPPDTAKTSVDIWNYRDEFLQSEQLANKEWMTHTLFMAVVSSEDSRVLRLEQEMDGSGDYVELNHGGNDDYAVTETRVNTAEGYWRAGGRPDTYLISTKDGSRKQIVKRLWNGADPHFSPGGKYLWWYDSSTRAYFTYDIRRGVTRNISKPVPVALYDELWDEAGAPYPYDPPEWLRNDEGLLISDRYDIWQVDPAGVKAPVNITNGYGRKNRTVLRLVNVDGKYNVDEPPIKKEKTLLLCGFNEITKDNGFFRKKIAASGDPLRLVMSPAVYYSKIISGVDFSEFVRKAKRADVYLLKRMSATEFPNLQMTRDFTTFKAMSDLQPQKTYKWFTSELVHWETFDHRPGEAILYKPEDFDPRKKYPIILNFYERVSAGLNKFIQPDLTQGDINIPWFLSHGYLVLRPDIHYVVGEPGDSAYKYVVSAAQMMAREPWVDAKRMGIQGHSWGGYEVNFLITRTGQFAAAASSAGPSDALSLSGILGFSSGDAHSFVEQGQPRMGVTLWQDPSGYTRNSPIFELDRVTTPLLILHNKDDGNVPWSQGVEMFTSLRRLRKRVWMLQYDGEKHGLSGVKAQLDYAIRLSQFFDHYLQDAPPPKWMTEGVPAQFKGIATGLALDASGKEP